MPPTKTNPDDDLPIRLAETSDLDGLEDLLRACVHEMQARGLDQWDDVYPDRATLTGDLEARSLYLAAAVAPPGSPHTPEQRLVGAFTLNARQEPEYAAVPWQISAEPVAVVHRLMVSPAAQRAGIGGRLMRFAEREAYRLGFRAIRLDTLDDNARALALYSGLGYRAAGGVRFRKGAFTCFEKALRPDGRS